MLDEALADIETAVDRGRVRDAQDATKRALEAIHELGDCLKRQEWSQVAWDADTIELWHAHLAARNAAHHTSETVVVLHGDALPDDRLRWELPTSAFATNPSQRQIDAYAARLDGEPVLSALRIINAAVTASVS